MFCLLVTMIGRVRNLKKFVIAGLFPGINVFDDTKLVRDTKTGRVILDGLQEEQLTGKERLYYMFSVDEFGELSPEMSSITQGAMMSALVGAVMGGFARSRTAFLNFIETNDASKFQSHLEAKSKLQSKVGIAFGKGAFEWAWRLTAFTSSYMFISTSISVYRGRNGIREHSIAGFVTGSLYKVNVGLRGVVVGACLGTVLGTLCGLLTWGLTSVTGISMDEVRNMNYAVKHSRDERWGKIIKNYNYQDAHPLENEHEEAKDKSNTLDALETPIHNTPEANKVK